MITITINGKEVHLDKQMTVLEAAKTAGIKIPTLCHHDLLKPYGGCRLCVVEVERMPKLQNSCTLIAADGMVIKTESDVISKVRREILELLLINHPLDCPYCDKAGECELQDLVDKYGPTVSRYKEEKRQVPESHADQIFTRHMGRCVVCTRCVRMCENVQGASAISIVGRGNHSRMEPFSPTSFNCEYCGNCLTVCPVGAILSRLYIHSFRPWQVDKEIETICPYCGVGCSLFVQVRDNSIKRVIPRLGKGLNKGLLCSRGRFGYEFIESNERLKNPLIRKNGKLEQGTWDDALHLIANKLTEIKKAHGGKAIAGMASPRCTNEDNYVFQKFMRMACRTNNIDSISRTGFAAAQNYIEDLLGQGVTSNMISGLKVIVIGNAKGLERFKTLAVVPPVFKEADTLELLLTNIYKAKGVRGEKAAVDKMVREMIEKPAGIEIKEMDELVKMLLEGNSISIVLGMDLVQRSDGHRSLFAIAALTYLLEARLFLLSEKPNEQGLIDMGCVPDMLPGGRPLDIGDFKHKFESAWKGSIPEDSGLTLLEMIEGMNNKNIKALYIMGENPAFNLPNGSHIKDALKSLDFLVVQDIFLTETAELADVVLPALGWAEKEGTYTNLERRVQLLKKAMHSSTVMEDWKILADVSSMMGYDMDYASSEKIMEEIAKVSPLYRDLTYKEISSGDCLWPYHGEPLRGELHKVPITAGLTRDYKADLYLSPEKPLFHSGTLSRRSAALRKICPEPALKISAPHAGKLGLKEGDRVEVSTAQGSINVSISIDDSIKDNRVLLGNNFEGRGVYNLLSYKIDAITKAPGIEGCEVKIERKQ
ncbi:MAG: molybdopterin-dependent oxidoreductase [Nitrospirae bacterium]|nr:molybdopterin-dependent oxidoreductase [Nitrospirota bacterium]